jgi:hypothetical protein
MERLEPEVRAELARFGPPGGMPEVVAAWPDAVGPMISANAWPARIGRDGTLYVNTSSSAWTFELSQLAPTLLARLAESLAENAPKALRFAVGHVPEAPEPEAEDRPAPTPGPTEEALQTAADLTAAITDDELRERVARAAALSLSRERSDSPF